MPQTLDYYVTIRSPYSYLSVPRVRELAKTPNVELCFRPVYPLAIRAPEFFNSGHPLLLQYLRRDVERVAEMDNADFAWPDPDPVIQDIETTEIADHQPYVYYLTRLLVAADEANAGFAFYEAVSSLIFDGHRAWNEEGALNSAATDAGLKFSDLHDAVTRNPKNFDAILDSNAARLLDAGHWGTPSLSCNGEIFFGQDRIKMCEWHLAKQRG